MDQTSDCFSVNMEREIAETKARLCLDCGKCTTACPVARYDVEFNPRLIVQRWLSSNGAKGQDPSIWQCLGCYGCVERCNYQVKFPEFIDALRYEAREQGHNAICSHGGSLQSLMRIMAGDIQQDRLGWVPDDIKVAEESDTAFFAGCASYFDVIFDDLGVQTSENNKGALRLLNRAGIEFALLPNERCCGHDLLQQGDRQGAFALAKANMGEFGTRGIKKIITGCPECLHMLRDVYPKITGERAFEIKHITEVLAPLVDSGDLKLGHLSKKVTYHDPCRLGRLAGLYDQARSMLKSVRGMEVVEMEMNRDKSLCCGATPWVNCGLVNRQVQQERLSQARATGAEMLVTACPKCQIHLNCAQKLERQSVPRVEIEDLVTLLVHSLEQEDSNDQS